MSRQIRISIDDDEVFERLKRRKDALDLSWEDALRRGLRDSPKPPRGSHTPHQPSEPIKHHRDTEGEHRRNIHHRRESDVLSPFDDDFGEQITRQVLSSVRDSVPEFVGEPLDEELGRLEDAENAELVLGDGEGERVPLRVTLYTGPEGLDIEVVTVRSGKGTEGMNRFVDGTRKQVAERFSGGETAILEFDAGGENYDVRPNLTWARGPGGHPVVADVVVEEVVFGNR